jgi:hypothetical protein
VPLATSFSTGGNTSPLESPSHVDNAPNISDTNTTGLFTSIRHKRSLNSCITFTSSVSPNVTFDEVVTGGVETTGDAGFASIEIDGGVLAAVGDDPNILISSVRSSIFSNRISADNYIE